MTTGFTEPMAGSRTGPALVSGGFGKLSARAGASCLEELNITDPKAVIELHRWHLDEGADILRTNTGGASPERLDRYRMHDEAFIVSYMAAEHASKAAREHGGGRRVMGVARVEALAPLIGFLPLDRVEAAARTMASGLVGGGADMLLLETAQCPARIVAALDGTRRGMADAGRSVPVLVKLRYETRLGALARDAITDSLARAAAAVAGIGAHGLALAPDNLDRPFAETLWATAEAYRGPLFVDLAPTSPHWAGLDDRTGLRQRIAFTAGRRVEPCETIEGPVRPAPANDAGPRPVARSY
ncbi:homocysteine S-methyltransferase family protein [Thalassobaculum sp. OXR-137]|uniref:homocysteine S-methyltransferase family protein n=1 Tax=Thalassobaculum sp. OXR-137 TaxID=3100173 RepID=UPI002AC8E00F|nr:homocysteine S-methyltransferase family protein [Thalassobaculum sp. OXR-137]WPZ36624.1 homocysteine S-methyltransferase family protein [Thalassobaculum sp. OXR-137]